MFVTTVGREVKEWYSVSQMHKWAWITFLVLFSSNGFAIERYGAVGTGVAVPTTVEPTTKRGNFLYTIDISFFMDEFWSAILDWDFGLEGEQRVNSGLGPRLFLFREKMANPYVSALFLYSFTPAKDIGWRASLGVEVNLKKLTELDNLRFFAESGAKQFYVDGPNPLAIEWIRSGLAWSF